MVAAVQFGQISQPKIHPKFQRLHLLSALLAGERLFKSENVCDLKINEHFAHVALKACMRPAFRQGLSLLNI